MHSTKSSGATRLVWRMTAENQLGEILELPEEARLASSRQPRRARRARPEQVARVAGSANASWRASSYDLLQGLSVRDVSEKIPQRAFDALFSPDAAAADRS